MKRPWYQIFCKHHYILLDESVVHYPDYEPHKIGMKWMCVKCSREKKELYEPHRYIKTYGRTAYDRILEDKRIGVEDYL